MPFLATSGNCTGAIQWALLVLVTAVDCLYRPVSDLLGISSIPSNFISHQRRCHQTETARWEARYALLRGPVVEEAEGPEVQRSVCTRPLASSLLANRLLCTEAVCLGGLTTTHDSLPRTPFGDGPPHTDPSRPIAPSQAP
jgi:hypothetical protein